MFLILAKLQNLNLIKNFYLPAVMPNRPIHCNEETISDASCTTASLTIEATLVFPFFILVFLTIIYWLNIFSRQTGLQIQLEESARKYNTTAYISEDSLETASISPVLMIQADFFSEKLKNYCNNSCIKNGYAGISFHNSTYYESKKAMDIIITYEIVLPFIPSDMIHIPFTQHCYFKLFNGNTITDSADKSRTKVYLTRTALVYHKNKYCSYLVKYTDIIKLSALDDYQKETGKKLSLCSLCKKLYAVSGNPDLYICATGNSYHYNRDCHYLTCDIYEYSFDEVKDIYPPCSRCSSDT